jgi:hypothetical protein
VADRQPEYSRAFRNAARGGEITPSHSRFNCVEERLANASFRSGLLPEGGEVRFAETSRFTIAGAGSGKTSATIELGDDLK